MLKITDKNIQELCGVLNATGDEKRLAAYSGVAASFTNGIINDLIKSGVTKVDSNTKFKIHDLFYELNEIAVLDKNMFTAIVSKYIQFKLDVIYKPLIINEFNDIIGVNDIFGKEYVKVIDGNIGVFNKAFNLSNIVLSKKD